MHDGKVFVLNLSAFYITDTAEWILMIFDLRDGQYQILYGTFIYL
jgi:hypothetical protein